MKYLATLLLFLSFSSLALAQEPTPQPVSQAWSFTTSGVALPGGKSTIAGTDAGVTFTPSPNLDLFERNLVSSDSHLQYYAGGFSYRIHKLSKAANNASQNVNFLRVQFFPTGSFGIARVNGINHYGYTAGGGINYMLNNSGKWNFGGSVEYAHFPGYEGKAVVKLGFTFRP